MIDKSLESIAPQGICSGPDQAFDLSVLQSRYGVEYQGGFGFDLLDAKMRRGVLKKVAAEDCLNLNVGGYVHALSRLKPLGGSADFKTETLSDLKYFLQGGPLRINDNFFYLKVPNALCPDDFAVVLASRTLLTPYSSFIRVNHFFDGILNSKVEIFGDSVRVEKADGRNVYKVIFDIEVALVKPLEQLSCFSLGKPIQVKRNLKFYRILKNFAELPECMDFNFGENGNLNTIAVKNVEIFLANHSLLRNILHLDSGKMNIHELGGLLGEFHPEADKREILTGFFGCWSAADFYKARFGCTDELLDEECPIALNNLRMTCSYSFKGLIRCDNLVQRLEECRNSLVQMKKIMGGFRGEPWSVCEKCASPYNEIEVRVKFDKDKTSSKDMNRAVFGDHLGNLKNFLQAGIGAFDVLIEIVKNIPFVVKESGAFNYSVLKHYLEALVRESIKSDPLNYFDFGCLDQRCAEIRDYAKFLIGGVA